MADAPLQIDVFPVQARAELGRPAQVGARSKDAEAATEPRHAGGIGPVRRLAGIVDNAEDVIGREIEDRQPVEPGPAGLELRSLRFQGVFRARAALSSARSPIAFTRPPPKRGWLFR